MSGNYRLVCDRHNPSAPLMDITYHADDADARHYDEQRARWDRHASGEAPIVNEADPRRRPYPPHFRPYMPRFISRRISILEPLPLYVPQLDEGADGDVWEHAARLSELAEQGKPLPHNGYVTAVDFSVGDDAGTDGHTFRVVCLLCGRTGRKPLRAMWSAETLALVLDNIGSALPTTSIPLQDDSAGEVIEVRLLSLARLRQELGEKPRG